ncbi:hypothetical protein MRX96_044836 [Rhipicephalus microplus]
MGSCVSALSSVGGDRSRRERTFQVWNLDEQGAEVSPGKIEVNANDLVLYQRGRPPVRWPLRGLRRYGFDAHLFSFESGRRCPTGLGHLCLQVPPRGGTLQCPTGVHPELGCCVSYDNDHQQFGGCPGPAAAGSTLKHCPNDEPAE